MNDPLPLPFDHDFSDDQLRWHWNMFKQQAPDWINSCVDNPDDAQFSWDAYMLGALMETKRGYDNRG